MVAWRNEPEGVAIAVTDAGSPEIVSNACDWQTWPEFLAGWLAGDRALHAGLIQAIKDSGLYRMAADGWASGWPFASVRQLLRRAVAETLKA